ncbi:MAG TPA: crosslink repair DNA glycosylase YcaQ family protein [Candidatus Limnocylindrales bacterium]|nr:crosslink repair DNA glycosylase YcaQ family protein [Candidatus Limnocylindrales bacterium]
MPKPLPLNGTGPDPIVVTREVARRFLVLRHFLGPPRSLPAGPAGVLTYFDRLGSLQFDPIDVAGRNHDLVLLARVAGYRRAWTDTLLYQDRALFEAYNKMLSILPTAELPWYRIAWDRARAQHERGAFDEHAPLVEELLERIRETGPMSSRDVEPRAAIDWYWRPTNQVRAILEALAEAGVLGIARRDGNVRVYDLIERLVPAELLERRPSVRDQFKHKLLSRYRAHGLLGATGPAELWAGTYPRLELGGEDGLPMGTAGRNALHAELVAAGDLLPVEIDGVRGRRHLVGSERGLLDQAVAEVAAGLPPGGAPAGVAFLAPLDPLAWDRDFLRACFDFDYVWEVYVPARKRRWGYYVLPLLHGDRLVGRIELRAERKAGVLRIVGAWWEDGFDPLADEAFAGALGEALEAHREFAAMRRVAWPRTARHRALAEAVKRAGVVDAEQRIPA